MKKPFIHLLWKLEDMWFIHNPTKEITLEDLQEGLAYIEKYNPKELDNYE